MTGRETTLLVIAKAPIAGFAKTRLTPPLDPRAAALVAAASLLDTLDAVTRSGVTHRVVAFTGDLAVAERGAELARALDEFVVFPQRGPDFGTRLANAHADAARFGGPVLQIGMDTPQVGPDVLGAAARQLAEDDSALLGPAEDGGWWALGLPVPQPAHLLSGVPMSTPRTGELTRDMVRHCGFRVRDLPTFRDVDTFADAVAVAAVSGGRFAATVDAVREHGLVTR
ncbi:TIGR04282 family arsenosugar biosynthesis glycosyltransferase [Nocardia aurea]|uniref:TIGR04282 family arsenosugar biosynthesis glycosyltransferase n=1 Tax=Nocardia aurea TaxID=2144174 RepID=UPI0033A02902